MTIVHLVEGVTEAVREAVRHYRLRADREASKGVTVYAQYIPTEKFKDEDGRYHPLIWVFLSEVEDDEGERSIATVNVVFAVYGESDETWQDLLNLVDTVRLRLLERPLINERYRMLMPLAVDVAEVQPRPFWYATMTVPFMLYQPVALK